MAALIRLITTFAILTICTNTPVLAADCQVAEPVVPCEIGTTTYDTFAGNYSGNRSFYKADSYTVTFENEGYLCLVIKEALLHSNGFAYVNNSSPTVYTSPAPYSVNFGIFGVFSGSCIERENGFEWIGIGSTLTQDASPLIDSLSKLKRQMLLKVDSDLENTTRAFGDSKSIRRSLIWSDWFGTALDLVSGTLTVISTTIDAVDEVKSSITTGLNAKQSFVKFMVWLHTANNLYERLTEDGEKLQLAIDGPAYTSAVKTMLKTAHDAACVNALTVCVEFDQTVYETAIRNQLNDESTSMVITLHKSSDVQRKKGSGVKGVIKAKRQIAAKLQSTINELKAQGTVPSTFPMAATLDMLNRIRRQVVLSRNTGVEVPYDSLLNNGMEFVEHSEKVSLGRIGDWEKLRKVALDNFSDNLKIQIYSTYNTAQDSVVNATTLAIKQQYKLPDGLEIVIDTHGYLTTMIDLHLAEQIKGSTINTRKVVDLAPQEMLMNLGDELSDLWMIADDVSNKILADALN